MTTCPSRTGALVPARCRRAGAPPPARLRQPMLPASPGEPVSPALLPPSSPPPSSPEEPSSVEPFGVVGAAVSGVTLVSGVGVVVGAAGFGGGGGGWAVVDGRSERARGQAVHPQEGCGQREGNPRGSHASLPSGESGFRRATHHWSALSGSLTGGRHSKSGFAGSPLMFSQLGAIPCVIPEPEGLSAPSGLGSQSEGSATTVLFAVVVPHGTRGTKIETW